MEWPLKRNDRDVPTSTNPNPSTVHVSNTPCTSSSHVGMSENDEQVKAETNETETRNNSEYETKTFSNGTEPNNNQSALCMDDVVTEVIVLEPIWRKLHGMTNLYGVLKAAVDDEGLSVTIEPDPNGLQCVLSGTRRCVDLASIELSKMKKSLCIGQCDLMITCITAVPQLSVTSYLDDILASKNLKCCVSQTREHILVRGFDQQSLQNACKLIESIIVERTVIMNETIWDTIEYLQQMAKHDHPGCIVFHFENRQKLFVIGVKEFVEEFIHKVTSPITGNYASNKKYISIKIKVPNENVCKFIRSSGVVQKFICENKLDLEFTKENNSHVVNVKGEESVIVKTDTFLNALVNAFVTKTVTVDDVKAIQYLLQDESNQLLQNCVTHNDVVLDLRTDQGGSLIEEVSWFPSGDLEHQCSWSNAQNTGCVRLTRRNQKGTTSPYYIEFKSANHSADCIKRRRNGMTVNVPLWNGGQATVFRKFTSVLMSVLEMVEKTDHFEILMKLEHTCDWPLENYIRRITKSVVQWLTSASHNSKLHTVVLMGSDAREYNMAKDMVNHELHRSSEKDIETELNVVVIPGELHNIKANVLVNTTGNDLDLSVGKVSGSLLKAAGKALQNECLEKYPNGITTDEIAETDGYKLHCNRVLHITLDRYMHSGLNDMGSIQTIRNLVGQCLAMTSKLGFESIAFPAIGTGILQYPVDLVSAAMFESVESFKSNNPKTSIKTVMFVIYPKNDRVMEVFKKNESDLYNSMSLKRSRKKKMSTLTVLGMASSVDATMKQMHELMEQAKTNPNEIIEKLVEGFTRMVYMLWSTFYSGNHDRPVIENVEWRHDEKSAVLRLKGKRNVLETLIRRIIVERNEIKSKYLKQLNFPDINPENVVSALESACSKHGDDWCMHVYDFYMRMAYVCGKAERVVAFERDIKKELGQVREVERDQSITHLDMSRQRFDNYESEQYNKKTENKSPVGRGSLVSET